MPKDLIEAMKLGLMILPIVSFLTSALYFSAFFMPFDVLSPKILSFQDYFDKAADLALLNILMTTIYVFVILNSNHPVEAEEFWPDKKVKYLALIGGVACLFVGYFSAPAILLAHYVPLLVVSAIAGRFFHKNKHISSKNQITTLFATGLGICFVSVAFAHAELKKLSSGHLVEFYDVISSGTLQGQSGSLTYTNTSGDVVVIDNLSYTPDASLHCILFQEKCNHK